MTTAPQHALPMPPPVRRALQPLPHALPSQALGASLVLDDVRDAVARLDRAALPADCRPMAPRRLLAFVAGRWCAQALLAQLGLEAAVGRHATGAPRWPVGCTGSIAHTDHAAYATLLPGPPWFDIGIDSETWPDDAALRVIREVCCSFEERKRLFAGRDERLVAAAVFSAKEAYYKAVHRRVGRVIEFTEVEVQGFDGSVVSLAPAPGSPLRSTLPAATASLVVVDNDTVHTCVSLPWPR